MGALSLTQRDLDAAVGQVVEVVDPVKLRAVLSELAAELGVDWEESGEGSATRLNAAAVAFVMDATTSLHRSFELWKRTNAAIRRPSRDVQERKECADHACVHDSHEWQGGERIEACELAPIDSPHSWYRVHADRTSDRNEWVVWVDADGLPEGRPAGAAVQSLATDIERMQGVVDRPNKVHE